MAKDSRVHTFPFLASVVYFILDLQELFIRRPETRAHGLDLFVEPYVGLFVQERITGQVCQATHGVVQRLVFVLGRSTRAVVSCVGGLLGTFGVRHWSLGAIHHRVHFHGQVRYVLIRQIKNVTQPGTKHVDNSDICLSVARKY